MDKIKQKIIWQKILGKGDLLKGKLPPHASHPTGRNPYAHVCLEIKNRFGRSYKDIPNEYFTELIDFIYKI